MAGSILSDAEFEGLVDSMNPTKRVPYRVPYAAYTDAHLMVIREQEAEMYGEYTSGLATRWSIQVVPDKPLGISPLTLSYTWTQFLEVLLGITGPIKDNEGRVCVFVFGPKAERNELLISYGTPMYESGEHTGIHLIFIDRIVYQ